MKVPNNGSRGFGLAPKALVAMLVAGGCIGTAHAGFYKCTDDSGKMQYQQTPCAGDQHEGKVHVYVGPRDPSEMGWQPYESSGEEPASSMPFQTKALLANALADLGTIKVMALQYYQMEGKWPSTLKDLRLDPNTVNSSRIEKVEFGADGAIVAHLAPIIGKHKKLVLHPSSAMGGTTMEWKCQTNLPKETLSTGGLAFCESRALR